MAHPSTDCNNGTSTTDGAANKNKLVLLLLKQINNTNNSRRILSTQMMGRAVRVFIYYISRTLLLTFYLPETAMLQKPP